MTSAPSATTYGADDAVGQPENPRTVRPTPSAPTARPAIACESLFCPTGDYGSARGDGSRGTKSTELSSVSPCAMRVSAVPGGTSAVPAVSPKKLAPTLP